MEYVKDPAEELGWRKIIHECDEGGAKEEMTGEEMESEPMRDSELVPEPAPAAALAGAKGIKSML